MRSKRVFEIMWAGTLRDQDAVPPAVVAIARYGGFWVWLQGQLRLLNAAFALLDAAGVTGYQSKITIDTVFANEIYFLRNRGPREGNFAYDITVDSVRNGIGNGETINSDDYDEASVIVRHSNDGFAAVCFEFALANGLVYRSDYMRM